MKKTIILLTIGMFGCFSAYSQYNWNYSIPKLMGTNIAWSNIKVDSSRLSTLDPVGRFERDMGYEIRNVDFLESKKGEIYIISMRNDSKGWLLNKYDGHGGQHIWSATLDRDALYRPVSIVEKSEGEIEVIGYRINGDVVTTHPSGFGTRVVYNSDTGEEISYFSPGEEEGGIRLRQTEDDIINYTGSSDKYHVTAEISLKTNNSPFTVWQLNDSMLYEDTLLKIPVSPGVPANQSMPMFVMDFNTLDNGNFIFSYRRDGFSFSGMFPFICIFDNEGEVLLHRDLSDVLGNELYTFSHVSVNDSLLVYTLYREENKIAMLDSDGDVLWNQSLTHWNGKKVLIRGFDKLPNNQGFAIIAREFENRDAFYLLQLSNSGDLTQIGAIQNQSDDIFMDSPADAITAMSNGDLLLGFFAGPDTIVDNQIIWQWIQYRFISLIKAEDLNYTTSQTESLQPVVNWSVYPNPTTSNWTINGPGQETQLRLRDNTGQLIKTLRLDAFEQKNISASDLAAGMYFLELKSKSTGEIIDSKKVILTRH